MNNNGEEERSRDLVEKLRYEAKGKKDLLTRKVGLGMVLRWNGRFDDLLNELGREFREGSRGGARGSRRERGVSTESRRINVAHAETV